MNQSAHTLEFNYMLNEDDFLTFQLFHAASQPRTKRRRQFMTWLIPAVYIPIGLALWFMVKPIFGIVFLVAGLGWPFFYGWFFRWRYERHFRNHIKDNYGARLGQPVFTRLGEDHIFTRSGESEGKMGISECKKLVELKDHFLLSLKNGTTFIFPKNAIQGIQGLKSWADFHEIPCEDMQDWIWK